MTKIVIVGGVAGGASAAARLRRLNEKDEIILFEKDEFTSFANCGLPYYIGNVITDRDKLIVQSVNAMKDRFAIDVRNFSEVVSFDVARKVVQVENKVTKEIYEETYDVLLLSPGASPIVPPFEGIKEATTIFTLRNIADTDAIYNYIEEKKPKNAIVVGGGFIGIEMAENLVERQIDVTLIEKMPQVLAPLDFEMAQKVHEIVSQHGVGLRLNQGVKAFKNEGHTVVLENGEELACDLVILAIGVKPNSNVASSANCLLGPRGHIVVDEQLRMKTIEGEVLQDHYAIGDVIEVNDFVTNTPTAIPLAWPANRQGRIVADIIHGDSVTYKGSQGSAVLKVFDTCVATTGNNERTLSHKGFPHDSVIVVRGNHAGYYPNAQNITLKVIFDPETRRVLGAQAVGPLDGTEKRIDVLATVIRFKGRIDDLPDLELCYAPPFSSAKDPVNIAGYVAQNVANKKYKTIKVNQVEEVQKNDAYFLDVRTPLEFELGHIEGAINIEIDQLRNKIMDLPQSKDTPIYINCAVGLRGYLAIEVLKDYGYTNLYNLSGGYGMYESYHYSSKVVPLVRKVEKVNEEQHEMVQPTHSKQTKRVDAVGLQCPGPLMVTYNAIQTIAVGDVLEVVATDYGFTVDAKKWAETNGHKLLDIVKDGSTYHVMIQKGNKEVKENAVGKDLDNATIVLFSGELDKAIAAMIIALGAAAQGKKVTIFFTFWGLNLLRKQGKVQVKKTPIEKMFGVMMPKGPKKMPLSSMNMMGMGAKMIKGIMKNKNVDQLEVMMQKAQDVGVNFMACTMSMDLMGIKEEELMDGISYGGVASYIGENDNATTTLFI